MPKDIVKYWAKPVSGMISFMLAFVFIGFLLEPLGHWFLEGVMAVSALTFTGLSVWMFAGSAHIFANTRTIARFGAGMVALIGVAKIYHGFDSYLWATVGSFGFMVIMVAMVEVTIRLSEEFTEHPEAVD